MRKFTWIVVTLFWVSSIFLACGQETDGPVADADEVIGKADSFIADRQYESAMNLLQEADPENSSPEIAIAKTDLLLNYYTESTMHREFGLKDLGPDETLQAARENGGEFTTFRFPVDSVLQSLMEDNPENYELVKSLGAYYHEVHLNFPNSWDLPDSVLVRKFMENYRAAEEHDVADYWSLYGIGYGHLLREEYEAAIPYLQRSIELNEDYPTSHYNLAYAYLNSGQRKEAINQAKRAMELYDYPPYIADAARIIGVIYENMAENEQALEFYREAYNIFPDDYYTLQSLLSLEVRTNQDGYRERSQELFQVAPQNPTIYSDLMQAYYNADKLPELVGFFNGKHTEYQNNDTVMANLHFFTGVVQLELANVQEATENFQEARGYYENVYQPDHQVFSIIDSYLNEEMASGN